jgi:hypothetical protein
MANGDGWAFKEGKLFCFAEKEVMLFHSWPEPRAVRKSGDIPWTTFCPEFPLIVPFRPPRTSKTPPQLELDFGASERKHMTPLERKRWALWEFRKTLPKPLAKTLESIRSLQWRLLLASHQEERFLELLQSNPVLAYEIIRQKPRLTEDKARLQTIASKPQRDLADDLGIPSSKSVLKILRKIHLPALDTNSMQLLREALSNNDARELLGHIPKIGVGLLEILGRPALAARATPRLLQEIAACKEELFRAPTARRMQNDNDLARELGLTDLTPYQSREHLLRLHREHVTQWNRQGLSRPSASTSQRLPPPPFPGNTMIRALTNVDEIREEGKQQNNCVATYIQRVMAGGVYLYSILWPERCTLSLIRVSNGTWQRGECEISDNREASAATKKFIDEWIETNQSLFGEQA